jgi:hypothetical protein
VAGVDAPRSTRRPKSRREDVTEKDRSLPAPAHGMRC